MNPNTLLAWYLERRSKLTCTPKSLSLSDLCSYTLLMLYLLWRFSLSTLPTFMTLHLSISKSICHMTTTRLTSKSPCRSFTSNNPIYLGIISKFTNVTTNPTVWIADEKISIHNSLVNIWWELMCMTVVHIKTFSPLTHFYHQTLCIQYDKPEMCQFNVLT